MYLGDSYTQHNPSAHRIIDARGEFEKGLGPTAAETDLLNRSSRRKQHGELLLVELCVAAHALDQRVDLCESSIRVLPGRPSEVVVPTGEELSRLSQHLQQRIPVHIVFSDAPFLSQACWPVPQFSHLAMWLLARGLSCDKGWLIPNASV